VADLDAVRLSAAENERALERDCMRLREERNRLQSQTKGDKDLSGVVIDLRAKAEEAEAQRARLQAQQVSHKDSIEREAAVARQRIEAEVKQVRKERDTLAAMLREVREEVVEYKLREEEAASQQAKQPDIRKQVAAQVVLFRGQIAALQCERQAVAGEVSQLRTVWRELSQKLGQATEQLLTFDNTKQSSLNESEQRRALAEREKDQTMMMFNAALRDARDACTVSFRHGAALSLLQAIFRKKRNERCGLLLAQWWQNQTQGSLKAYQSLSVTAVCSQIKAWRLQSLGWGVGRWHQAVKRGDRQLAQAAREASQAREVQLTATLRDLKSGLGQNAAPASLGVSVGRGQVPLEAQLELLQTQRLAAVKEVLQLGKKLELAEKEAAKQASRTRELEAAYARREPSSPPENALRASSIVALELQEALQSEKQHSTGLAAELAAERQQTSALEAELESVTAHVNAFMSECDGGGGRRGPSCSQTSAASHELSSELLELEGRLAEVTTEKEAQCREHQRDKAVLAGSLSSLKDSLASRELETRGMKEEIYTLRQQIQAKDTGGEAERRRELGARGFRGVDRSIAGHRDRTAMQHAVSLWVHRASLAVEAEERNGLADKLQDVQDRLNQVTLERNGLHQQVEANAIAIAASVPASQQRDLALESCIPSSQTVTATPTRPERGPDGREEAEEEAAPLERPEEEEAPKQGISVLRQAFSDKMIEYEKRIADARFIRKQALVAPHPLSPMIKSMVAHISSPRQQHLMRSPKPAAITEPIGLTFADSPVRGTTRRAVSEIA